MNRDTYDQQHLLTNMNMAVMNANELPPPPGLATPDPPPLYHDWRPPTPPTSNPSPNLSPSPSYYDYDWGPLTPASSPNISPSPSYMSVLASTPTPVPPSRPWYSSFAMLNPFQAIQSIRILLHGLLTRAARENETGPELARVSESMSSIEFCIETASNKED